MPAFDTPEPISLAVDLGIGDIRIVASDRVDTVVDVQPSDPARKADVTAARQIRVEFANGTLLVKSQKGWRGLAWGDHGSVDVTIEIPTGSSVRGRTGVTNLRATGRIGTCRYHTGVGDITVESAEVVELKAGAGDISVDEVAGSANIKTAGAIAAGRIGGAAAVKNSNGDTWIGETLGEARVSAANGAIAIDRAMAGLVAKTANGDVRVGEVVSGSIVAQSAFGSLEVGVRDGVSAWLELATRFGHVRNDLEDTPRPGPGEGTVEVHAHTSMGDIHIRHAEPSTGKREP